MNIDNEIRKINHDSILDFDLKLTDFDIEELDQNELELITIKDYNDDNSEINRIDSLLDYEAFYDCQFHH